MDAVRRYLSFSVFQTPIINILLSLAVILVFLLAQKPSSRAIVKAMGMMLRRITIALEESMLKVLEMPIRFLFAILGFLLSLKILNLPKPVDVFFIHLILTLVLFSIFWMVYRFVDIFSGILHKYANKTETKLDDMLMPFFSKGLKTVIIILGIVFVLQEWKFNIAGILTGLGLGGLAFALAAKDTLSNLFGSVMIMIDRPFVIGDWIMTSHVEGVVEEIGFRSTRVRTFAQAIVSIPNSIMTNEPITNWSRMQKRRINFRLGLTYATSEQQLLECLNRLRQILENHPDVHKDTIMVYFEKFGDSALEIFIYFFTYTTNWQTFMQIQEDINMKIMRILEDLKLSVAFPSRTVYIEK